jgi:hypothetical protein
MAALSIAGLRQAMAARIGGLSGWWEAPVPFDSFGLSGVPDAVPALKTHPFVVGTPSTPLVNWRQKASEGVYVETDTRVRFFSRHTPGPTRSQASADAATAAEQALIARVMSVDAAWPRTFDLELVAIPTHAALTTTGEWFLSEIQFTARHIYALA